MEMECCSYMLPLVASCFFFLCSFCHALLATRRRRRRSGGVCCGPRHAPRSHPVLGCLVEYYRNRRRLLDWYTGLLAASPSQTVVVERLGARRTVVTANPVNVEHILKDNFGNYPKGKPFTEVLGDLLGGGIFNADGEPWRAQRKLLSHEFTARALRERVGAALEAETRSRLLPALDAAAAAGGDAVVDVQELLRLFAFNVICRVSLGADDPGDEAALPLSRLAAAFEAAAAIVARRGAAPVAAVWKAKRALGVGSERRLREEVRVIHDAITELVRRGRRRRHGHRPAARCDDLDLVSRMAAAGYGDEAIRDMVISFIMAGRDTTSSALTWFFWLMTRHRDVEREVLGEMDSSSPRPCDDRGGVGVDLDGSRKMRVLHAALCETMRLYPPVAWDSKHAAEADVLPDGTRLGRGDRVTYFPYGMGRMESIWGADAGEFRPRRWLALPSREEGGVSPFKFPVFQGGPRTCLGREMAFLQMKFVATAVLRRFELRALDKGRQPVFVPLLTAHMAGGLKVTVRRREEGAAAGWHLRAMK